MGKKVQAYAGMEIQYKYNKDVEAGQNTFSTGGIPPHVEQYENTFTKNTLGFGIPIGVQFYFSDKLLISTEMNVESMMSLTKNKFENSNQSEPIFGDDRRTTSINFRRPVALFLNFRF